MILEHHPDTTIIKDKPYPSGKAIGYWHSKYQQHLPKPQDYVDASWNKDERDKVIEYLQAGKRLISWMGMSHCRFCNKDNGSCCLTDDTYVWPQGFAHYIQEHNVKPPEEFVKYVLDNWYSTWLPKII